MGLKQSVVVVNEFTMKTGSKGGTRGGTPGQYVLRYMSRDGATECIAPIRRDTLEDYTMRYMARESAVDDAIEISSQTDDVIDVVHHIKSDFRKIQGRGGVAFGYGSVSLSHNQLLAAAKDIQQNFDKGKTVFKTVISFTEDYLREMNVIDPDFVFDGDGSYRGNIDQMKLRMGIMHGLKLFGQHYDDLQYIGVIQVDTGNVHCHLAMVDRGHGTVMYDGTQRGKLSDKGMMDLRRGIDNYLSAYSKVKVLSSSYQSEKENTVAFIKKYTSKAIEQRSFSQMIIACLPQDRGMWRANSKAKEMRRANTLVREYVEEILASPDSGYKEACDRVDAYAEERYQHEDLDRREYNRFKRDGRNKIIESGMDSVYSMLRRISPTDMTESPYLMSVTNMSAEELANNLGNDEEAVLEPARNSMRFVYKLKSYKGRFDHHREQYTRYHDAVGAYRQVVDASPAAQPVLDFFEIEEAYNERLMAKYQMLLNIVPPEDEYREDLDSLLESQQHAHNLSMMLADNGLRHMKEQKAEDYGLRVYFEEGGGDIAAGRVQLVERRMAIYEAEVTSKLDGLNTKLAGYGLMVDYSEMVNIQVPDRDNFTEGFRGEMAYNRANVEYVRNRRKCIIKQKTYEFDEVKSLDVHHMLYDFPSRLRISQDNADAFVEMADARFSAYESAREYLIASGQEDALENLPGTDIRLQHEIAEQLRSTTISPQGIKEVISRRQDVRTPIRRVHTVDLDRLPALWMEDSMKETVKRTLATEFSSDNMERI